jgi:hypothetical protein
MITHDGSATNTATAVQFDAETAGAIAVGDTHACFVSDTTGTIHCAGHGEYAQLGNGLDTTSATLMIAPTVLIK